MELFSLFLHHILLLFELILTVHQLFGLILFQLLLVLLLAVIGYATYLLFFADRNRREMVLLRSLGFAHVQMVGLLILEHLFIVFMGLSLGIWAGFQMSILTIPTISMTEGSGSVVPPVLVRADWKILMGTYMALVTAFALMLFIMKKNIFRWDLQSISRV